MVLHNSPLLAASRLTFESLARAAQSKSIRRERVFLVSTLAPLLLDFAHAVTLRALVLQLEPARRLRDVGHNFKEVFKPISLFV